MLSDRLWNEIRRWKFAGVSSISRDPDQYFVNSHGYIRPASRGYLSDGG
jgi:hypothetical protein